MSNQKKTEEQLSIELQKLQQAYNSLQEQFKKNTTGFKQDEINLKGLADIVENSINEIYVFDINTLKFKYVNKKAFNNLGYSREEIFEIIPVDINPEYTQTSFFQAVQALLSGEKDKLNFETIHQRKDGSTYSVDVHLQISDYEGEKAFVAIILDLTEWKKAEEALKRSEYILKESQKIAKIGGWEYDVESGKTYLSDEVFNIYGLPNDKMIKPEEGIKFYHSDDRQLVSDSFTKAITEGISYDIEVRIINAEGKNRWVNTVGKPVSKNGKIVKILGALMDITNRKLSETQLIKSNKRYKAFISVSNTGAWEYNTETDFLWCSPEYFSMLGRDANEYDLSGKSNLKETWIDLLHPEDRERASTHFANYLKKSLGMYENYFRMQHSDGHWVWILSRGNTLHDENGKITNLTVGTHINITEQKQAEEEIKTSNQQLLDILESMSDAFVALDRNWCYTHMNKKAAKLFDRNAEDIIGKHIWTEFPEGIGQPFHLNYEKVMNEKVFIQMEEYYPFYDKWFENRINPTEGGIAIFFTDITERKRAEKQLKLMGRAIDQNPVTIVITNINGSIEYVNPKFTEITGYTYEEVMGENPRVLQSGEHSQEFYKNLWSTILSGKDWHGEFHNKKKNGEDYWESAIISPVLDDSGNISSFVAVKEDITEKKKMIEDLVIAKEKAEESDRLKSAFLANMSHEIRTPMNGILGFTNILSNTDIDNSERQKYTAIINKSGKRLMNTINDLIDISKIEAGQMELVKTETSINKMFDELYDVFSHEAADKELSLTPLPTSSNTEATVLTDNSKLYGILTNLINNALKYTDKGSISFGYTFKDDFIEFYVKDTGIGVPKNRQQAIFNRFEQADIADKRAFQGSGLGLAISKAYVKMLGGKIWLESEEGVGSTFYFTLPYNTEKKTKNNIQTKNSEDLTYTEMPKLKILIAEDDEASEMLISIIVKDFCTEILKAKTGKETIEICRNNPDINLILMDIQMPEINGYEATHQIRQFNKEVIIIAQTAFALSGDYEKALAAGCDDYITKPINKKLLLELISKLTNSNKKT